MLERNSNFGSMTSHSIRRSASPNESLSQSLVERLTENQSRFNGLELSESDIEDIVRSASLTNDIILDLSGAMLGGDGGLFLADAISRNKMSSLVHINLNATKISREGFEALMYVAVEFRCLETLSVRNNSLPKEAGISLAKVMGARGRLRALDIQNNCLGDIGVAAIAGAFTADLRDVSHSTSVSLLTLEEIDLSGNQFGDAAVLALCRGLSHFSKHVHSIKRKPSLRCLKLNRNNLGDKAAMCLAQLLQSNTTSGSLCIDEIYVNDNPIGFRGMISLLGSTQDGARSTLQVLSMARCRPNLSVLDMAALVLSSSSSLTAIDMSFSEKFALETAQETGFSETLQRLADAVSTNTQIQSLLLGELPEIVRRALSASQIGSAPHQKIRDALDALRSMQNILKLTVTFQASIANDLASHPSGGTNVNNGNGGGMPLRPTGPSPLRPSSQNHAHNLANTNMSAYTSSPGPKTLGNSATYNLIGTTGSGVNSSNEAYSQRYSDSTLQQHAVRYIQLVFPINR